MYAREIEGQTFSFGVSGKLVRNVLVMYDRQTESYWSQLLGEAIAGEMAGARLEFLPSWQTTWAQWKALYPDTLALEKRFAGSADVYESYYQSGRAGIIGETFTDDRLYTKEFVLGVELRNAEKAYPFRFLSLQQLINDNVAGQSLLVFFDAQNAAGVVYSPVVDGRILTFEETVDPLMITDTQTNSLWDAFTGHAVEGPLVGRELERLKSTTIFWFGWKDFFPDTLVYGIDGG